MLRNTISLYNNAEDSKSKKYYSFDIILEWIKSDPTLIPQTKKARAQTHEEDYKKEKNKLPMVAYNGIFDYRNDDLENLREYSNIIVLDFDDFPSYEAAGEFKKKLISYADRLHLYAAWFSPSGKGIKAAMIHDNTNPEYHYNLFWQIKKNLYPKTKQFDEKCYNISRTFFLSSDPDIYINPNKEQLVPYHFKYDHSIPKPSKKSYNKGCSSTNFVHTEEEMERNMGYQNLWKDKTLINYIDKKWRKEYPKSYEDGNRHRSILSRAKWLCRYGVLYEDALFYLTGTFGLHGISEEDIEGMVINNYNANRDNFGEYRMELYSKKQEGRAFRNLMLKENTPFQK